MLSHRANKPFHVIAKAIGPICNLDCKYCFYQEKEQLYPDNEEWKISDEVAHNSDADLVTWTRHRGKHSAQQYAQSYLSLLFHFYLHMHQNETRPTAALGQTTPLPRVT